MKNITKETVTAFYNAIPFKKSNMEVIVLPNVTVMKFKGYPIAYRYNDPEQTLSITVNGMYSQTVKDRLNALNGVVIKEDNGIWLLNGKQWNGELIDIKETI